MATITRENIAPLTDKLIVHLQKEDYLPSFEKSIKQYAKNANIPGFRKGMVPIGMVKKMYGASIFYDQIFRKVDEEINKYIQENHLAILAQPLPLDENKINLDVNNPSDYDFNFEIGLQPDIDVDVKNIKVKRYNIEVTDKMIDEEVERLANRLGEYNDVESIEAEKPETIISADVQLTGNEEKGNTAFALKEVADKAQKEFIGKKIGDIINIKINKAFGSENIQNRILSDLKLDKEDKSNLVKEISLTITKLGALKKAELNEDFFKKVYPNKEIKTEQEFRDALKKDLQKYFAEQASNQLNDQIYHHLVDHTKLNLPEAFLKRWIVASNNGSKTEEDAEKEYPTFAKQLQWALISSKLSSDNNIKIETSDLQGFARNQIMQQLGGQIDLNGDESWMDGYVDRVLKDKKYVEEAHGQIRISRLFDELGKQVTATDENISEEGFAEILKQHHHH